MDDLEVHSVGTDAEVSAESVGLFTEDGRLLDKLVDAIRDRVDRNAKGPVDFDDIFA